MDCMLVVPMKFSSITLLRASDGSSMDSRWSAVTFASVVFMTCSPVPWNKDEFYSFCLHWKLLPPPRKMFCVCVYLLAGLREKLRTDFSEISWTDWFWVKDQSVRIWWRSESESRCYDVKTMYFTSLIIRLLARVQKKFWTGLWIRRSKCASGNMTSNLFLMFLP